MSVDGEPTIPPPVPVHVKAELMMKVDSGEVILYITASAESPNGEVQLHFSFEGDNLLALYKLCKRAVEGPSSEPGYVR